MAVKREDWTLLVLAAAGGEPLEPVALQKALFLVAKNVPADERRRFYKFRAYDYGPFCANVYSDAEELQAIGLAEIECPTMARHRHYRATPEGIDRANTLRTELRPETTAYLDRMVPWVRSMPFQDLVRAIYKAYPEMRANSVFRD